MYITNESNQLLYHSYFAYYCVKTKKNSVVTSFKLPFNIFLFRFNRYSQFSLILVNTIFVLHFTEQFSNVQHFFFSLNSQKCVHNKRVKSFCKMPEKNNSRCQFFVLLFLGIFGSTVSQFDDFSQLFSFALYLSILIHSMVWKKKIVTASWIIYWNKVLFMAVNIKYIHRFSRTNLIKGYLCT